MVARGGEREGLGEGSLLWRPLQEPIHVFKLTELYSKNKPTLLCVNVLKYSKIKRPFHVVQRCAGSDLFARVSYLDTPAQVRLVSL